MLLITKTIRLLVFALLIGSATSSLLLSRSKNLPPGEIMLISLKTTSSTDKYNKYAFSEYPGKNLFIEVYVKALTEKLHTLGEPLGVTAKMSTFEDILALSTSSTLPGMLTDYLYLDEDIFLYHDLSHKKLTQNLKSKSLISSISVVNHATTTTTPPQTTYYMLVELEYSMVNQKSTQKITLISTDDASVRLKKKIKLTSTYILIDKHSPFLITDTKLNSPPSESSYIEEIQQIPHSLGEQAAEEILKAAF